MRCAWCLGVDRHAVGCPKSASVLLDMSQSSTVFSSEPFPRDVMKRVHEEMVAQSHRPYPAHDLLRMAALVGEESGELLGAVLEFTRFSPTYTPNQSLIDIATEARHTAAMAIKMLVAVNEMLQATQPNITFPPTVEE